MADFVIIPDSSSDMIRTLRDRFDIPDYVPGVIVTPSGEEQVVDMDWQHHSPQEFYNSMSGKNALYKTACAPMGAIMAVYEKQLAQGKDVLAITLSSGLSATYHGCQMAAKELLEKYPDRKIICVDSLRYSGAVTLLTVLAAQKRDTGASLEETVAYLEETRHRIHQMGVMDDLFFLAKTKRVTGFKALFGTMVGMNILADFNRQGVSHVLGKVKGKKAALQAITNYVEQTAIAPQDQLMIIAHSNRLEIAQALAGLLQQRVSPKEIFTLDVGMSCGASIGPGLCSVFYLGQPISETMEQEAAILAKALEKA